MKKIKFSKFLILLLFLCISFFSVNLVVNADSVYDSNDYSEISYYNWDSIIFNTNSIDSIVSGNDTFTSTYCSDYFYYKTKKPYFVFNEVLDYSTFPFVSNITFNVSNYSTDRYGTMYNNRHYNLNRIQFISLSGQKQINFINYDTSAIILNSYNFTDSLWGSSSSSRLRISNFDVSQFKSNDELLLLEWILANGTLNYENDKTFQLERSINVIDSTSLDFCFYESTFFNPKINNVEYSIDSIVFEKKNYFLKVKDLRSSITPSITALVLNGGYNITYEIEGYYIDNSNNINNITSIISNYNGLLGTNYLYPSKTDLFGVSSINGNNLMYIKYYRVVVEFPNNYSDNLCYNYGVFSKEYEEINYNNALTSWVSISQTNNIGSSLLSSVNSFMSFEIVPGLSLLNILMLLVAIPLLIWILKLFLGG